MIIFWIALFQLSVATPNFESAIVETQSSPVSLLPEFGEGDGSFNPYDRFKVPSYNCMTWFQWVVATAYSDGTQQDFERHLDAIRYYKQNVGFDTRKHFIERWLIYEPKPLESVELPQCNSDRVYTVDLRLDLFREHHRYSCSFYQESGPVEQIVVPYLSKAQMASCMNHLPDGFYALFMVPNDKWLSRWSSVGDLATVHAMIVHRTHGQVMVYQASIDKDAVVREHWSGLEARLASVARGYRIYRFDSDWSVKPESTMSASECR